MILDSSILDDHICYARRNTSYLSGTSDYIHAHYLLLS
jgi:hypothetical protein